MSKTQSEIQIKVLLDEKKLPKDILWEAKNDETPVSRNAKAMFLSFFDRDSFDTMKIDLWTNDMQVNEMDRFVFQSLRSIAEAYFKATNNAALANDMQRFVQYFGEQTEIIPKE